MFGMAWTEILVIMALAAILIGPKDIPKIMYTLGRLFRRFQYVKFAMSQQFDDILKAGDIEELRKGVNFEARATDERAADADETFGQPQRRHDIASPRNLADPDGREFEGQPSTPQETIPSTLPEDRS